MTRLRDLYLSSRSYNLIVAMQITSGKPQDNRFSWTGYVSKPARECLITIAVVFNYISRCKNQQIPYHKV